MPRQLAAAGRRCDVLAPCHGGVGFERRRRMGGHHRLRLVRVRRRSPAHRGFRTARDKHRADVELDLHPLVQRRRRHDLAVAPVPSTYPDHLDDTRAGLSRNAGRPVHLCRDRRRQPGGWGRADRAGLGRDRARDHALAAAADRHGHVRWKHPGLRAGDSGSHGRGPCRCGHRCRVLSGRQGHRESTRAAGRARGRGGAELRSP
jgi:hypothetical protein